MNIGDKAPEVLGLDQNGLPVLLSQYKGKRLLLYFYPKDLTTGCTAEACSLRDRIGDIQAEDAEVVGVSVQDAKSHQRFIEKHALPFRLIADTDHTLVEAFDVWKEKSMYGRKYMGTVRTSFLIDEDGRIARIFSPKEIKTKTHGDQVVAALQAED